VSGMAPILASRCGRMAPGMEPPTVCPALRSQRPARWRPVRTVSLTPAAGAGKRSPRVERALDQRVSDYMQRFQRYPPLL